MSLSLVVPPEEQELNVPPHNFEAEWSVLGSLIMDNAVIDDLSGLRAEHFYEGFHSRLFAEIARRRSTDSIADLVTILHVFAEDPSLKELGGRRYIADLVDKAPPGRTAVHYAAIIIDLATKRQLAKIGDETSFAARREAGSAVEQLAAAERALAELAAHNGAPVAWASAGKVASEALAAARAHNGMVGLSTGLHDLDDAIGGLRKGQLIIIAGRPAMGKSSAGLQIAKAVARKGRGVCFFSMEMPAFDLGLRMTCDIAHDPLAIRFSGARSTINPQYFDAARGRLDQEGWWKLEAAHEDIANWPLLFDVTAGLTVAQMVASTRRQIAVWRRQGIEPGCVVVDHLTIARPDQDRKGNKVAEVGDISRSLAEMAKQLDIPVVALCQLSRDVEKGGRDKRPTLSDLRWSGEIEQDARVVAFLYRPEYYLRPPEDQTDFQALVEHREKLDKVRHKLFWIIEKNNNGPTTQVETYCDIACSAIRDKLGPHEVRS